MGEPKFVEINGIRTRYFETGTGDPLLLIHGGQFGHHDNIDSADNWDLNWNRFAAEFHVHAVDRLGQGYTDNPKGDDYTIEAVIAHLRGFLRHLGHRRLHLVGHSRGAYMATRLACEEARRIATLTVVDSATLAPPKHVERGPLLADAPVPLLSRQSLDWVTRRFSSTYEHVTDAWLDARDAIGRTEKNKQAVAAMSRLCDSVFEPGLYRQKEETLAWIRNGGLTAPTLLVWGKNDPSAVFSSGLALYELVAGSAPDAQFHAFNRAGHYSYRENPDAFPAVVTAFVRNAAGADRG